MEEKGKEEERIGLVLERLAAHYPQARTALKYDNPYQLFVATVLSAQTTDEQVNRITADLFKAAPSVYDLSRMNPSELEPYVKRCGLYRHKSRYLVEAARVIVRDYEGRVPDQRDQLIKLPGVGRKTANIIISSAYGKPAIAVDTHVFRVSKRLGLAGGSTVEKVEEQLEKVIPMEQWSDTHHRLIAHGRKICQARSPQCADCFLEDLCVYNRERGDKK